MEWHAAGRVRKGRMTSLSRKIGQGDGATDAPPHEVAGQVRSRPPQDGGAPGAAAQAGATVVEYAILLALIAMAVIATVYLLGLQLDAAFQELLELIEEHFPTGSGNGG